MLSLHHRGQHHCTHGPIVHVLLCLLPKSYVRSAWTFVLRLIRLMVCRGVPGAVCLPQPEITLVVAQWSGPCFAGELCDVAATGD